jgi:segregation and condensation protein B
MNQLAQSIEAILFATAEPQSFKALANRLSVSESEIADVVSELKASYEGRGIMLLEQGQEVHLATRPEQAKIIEAIRKEELTKELTKASAETLAIIAYLGSVSKAQIEFIRGVNVSYTLRSLQMRGLIEQEGGGRAITYRPSLELLQHYGIASVAELPLYAETKNKLEALLSNQS